MNKIKTISINLLVVGMISFIVLSSVFMYKYFSLRNDIQSNNKESELILKVYNEGNLMFENETKKVAGKSVCEILQKDKRFIFQTGNCFLISVDGIENDTTTNKYWMIYSPTHISCKNEKNQSCSVGAGELYLGSENTFFIKYEEIKF